MKKIGLLSDTHGYLNDRIFHYFEKCDEIWHAGDIGSLKVADDIAKQKPLRAVYGNIDGTEVRKNFPKDLRFHCEEVDVWITHIGGYPGNYSPDVRARIFANPPKLFICGHSHILKVMYDEKLKLLHVNPGAAGNYGIHKVMTIVRFSIDRTEIKDMEVIELGKRGA
jgi:uncharacterized protein